MFTFSLLHHVRDSSAQIVNSNTKRLTTKSAAYHE